MVWIYNLIKRKIDMKQFLMILTLLCTAGMARAENECLVLKRSDLCLGLDKSSAFIVRSNSGASRHIHLAGCTP